MIDADTTTAMPPVRDPARLALVHALATTMLWVAPPERGKVQATLDVQYRNAIRQRWPHMTPEELDSSSHRLWRAVGEMLARIEGAAPADGVEAHPPIGGSLPKQAPDAVTENVVSEPQAHADG